MCAECSSGWYRLGEECRKCSAVRSGVVVAALVVGGCVVIFGVLVFSLSEGLRYKFAAVVIALNSFQVTALYGQLELDWGPVAEMYFAVVSSVNLNIELTSPECSLDAGMDVWVFKWLLTLCLPLFVAAGLAAAAAAVWALIKLRVAWFATRTVAQLALAVPRAYFQLLVLLYLPLTSAGFALFGCRKDEAGRWVFAAAPARSCYNSAWWALFPVGLAAASAYGFAIPGTVLYVLRTRRASLDAVTFALRYGFLVNRFGAAFWWFEGAIMARKLGVVVCMTFFFTNDGKANAAVVALAATLGHLAWARPYTSAFHNALAVVVLAATTLVLHGGTYRDYALRRTVVIAGLLVNTGAIVVGNAIDLVLIRRAEDEAEKDFELDEFGVGDFDDVSSCEVQSMGDVLVYGDVTDVPSDAIVSDVASGEYAFSSVAATPLSVSVE